MRQLIKQNVTQVLLATVAVVGLVWLFVNAQPVDPNTHNLVVSDLTELQKRDAELAATVLQLRYRSVNNYDSAVALMHRIEQLGDALTQHHQAGRLQDSLEVRHELESLKRDIAQKSFLLDEFKSSNAVMKNSLIYLPRMLDRLFVEDWSVNKVHFEMFERLLRDALLAGIKDDKDSIEILEFDVMRLERALPSFPVKMREQAQYGVHHAKLFLQANKAMASLLPELSSRQHYSLGVKLETLHKDYYASKQFVASTCRFFLFLTAISILYFTMVTYYRLKEKRGQLEQALSEISNQQYALNQHAIVSITDVKGNITYVNDKFVEISGYTAEELLGKNHRMIQSGYHNKEFIRELWETVSQGKVWRGQVKNQAKDGHFYWVEATIVPFMNERGKPYQYVSMRTDITAQKLMKQQIESDHRLLQNVMDTLGEGVYMLDVDGVCTYLNREAEAIIGWRSDELLGKVLHDIIHSTLPDGTYVPAHECPVQIAMLANKIYRSDNEYFQHKNGTIFPVSMVAAPIKDGDNLIGSVVAFTDISERKFTEIELLRARDAAEAASRAKGDFLAIMSHEIRTPMNGIIGMTELALDTELNAEQREYLSLVKFSADSLLSIINDILDFSKFDSGKLELESIEFNVRTLFAATEKTLSLRAEQKALELVYDVENDVPEVLLGDPTRLRQILTNLLGNAIKFSEHGSISLTARFLGWDEQMARIRIEVEDCGIGIPLEKQAHIFDAFTQADSSTTRKYGGTGLGLAISSRLVTAMGGTLTVQSQEGVGSVFGFDLAFQIGQLQAQQSSFAELSGMSVLIVDDNAINCHLLSQLLKKWGMNPVSANSAAEALIKVNDAIKEGRAYRLLLLDAMMPETDGFQLAEQLKQMPEAQYSSIMMLSSMGLHNESQRCMQLGISAHLTKPIAQDELLQSIIAVLGVAKAGRAPSLALEKPSTRKLTILLAEDNPINQRLALLLLTKWGHHVDVANNGVEAVEMNLARHYDVILMDMQMPEMGGVEATRLIRSGTQDEHVYIIAMTANAMKEDEQRCLDAGMDEYISKPLNTNKLYALLNNFDSRQTLPSPLSAAEAKSQSYDYDAALLQADGWIVNVIGQAFLDECDKYLASISEAILARDVTEVQRGVHTLRGLVGNFNARSIEKITSQIEELSVSDEMQGIDELNLALGIEMNLLKISLARYLANISENRTPS